MTQNDPLLTDLTEYLREISQYPLLTADQETELARQMAEGARAGRRLAKLRKTSASHAESTTEEIALEGQVRAGLAARQRLVESNLRLVVSIAGRYRGRGLSLQDLIQEGNIGLQTGIEKFEWRKGYRLSTYVYWWIRQAMTRALANDSRTIRLPVHAGELLRTATLAEQNLTDELGRPPALTEVAERVGVQPHRLHAIRQAASTPESLDEPLTTDSSLTRADTVADEQASDPMASAEDDADLQQTLGEALEHLPDRERAVVKLHYGVGTRHAWTLDEIGKHMGVTRERARQIESQAMRRLRNNTQLRRALVELIGA
ncbi:MAG TPA: sigma-70 family RNA polymerase sigma factor [Chloroflexota bacterium]|jgi:RNA polymerase primary sigma factor